jgi:hypothetical protein
MHSLTEKTQRMDEKLEHASVVVAKYFEYIYVVLSHFEGRSLVEQSSQFCNACDARVVLWLCNRFETFMLIEVSFLFLSILSVNVV